MNIQDKIYEMRDEELVSISPKEKKELLEICPNYYNQSELEQLITSYSTEKLKDSFEQFCSDTQVANSFFNKKYYLAGLKDGMELFDFFHRSKKE